jgi:hypothetical protein
MKETYQVAKASEIVFQPPIIEKSLATARRCGNHACTTLADTSGPIQSSSVAISSQFAIKATFSNALFVQWLDEFVMSMAWSTWG